MNSLRIPLTVSELTIVTKLRRFKNNTHSLLREINIKRKIQVESNIESLLWKQEKDDNVSLIIN